MQIFEPEKNPFKSIIVDITHRCQMNCSNCYLPNRTMPDMDIKNFFDCIQRFPKKATFRLSGGEPTLRKDLPDIISKIVKLGHRPIILTNGLKLADLQYAQSLRSAGLKYVHLSLNGFNSDKIYEIIDQMSCAKEKMMAIENSVKAGISVVLSCILVKELNAHLVGELLHFVETLPKPARINFRNIGAIGRNMSTQTQTLSMDEMVQLVADKTGISPLEILRHKTVDNQIRFNSKIGKPYSQQVIIKITDWNTVFSAAEVNDPKSMIRGRITKDFKLAPHFEHVKANEFGY